MNFTMKQLEFKSLREIHPAELHIHFSVGEGKIKNLNPKKVHEAFMWFIEAELEKLELIEKHEQGEQNE
jgi:hypothetical protein